MALDTITISVKTPRTPSEISFSAMLKLGVLATIGKNSCESSLVSKYIRKYDLQLQLIIVREFRLRLCSFIVILLRRGDSEGPCVSISHLSTLQLIKTFVSTICFIAFLHIPLT